MKLLVAALERELVAFPADVPGFDRLVTGPGKLQATFALTRALERRTYEQVVVVGTAGGVSENVGSAVYEITRAVQHDVTDLDGIVGQHVSLPQVVEHGAGGHTIATGDQFVSDAETTARIRSLGATLVDMEVYAYVWVAQQYGIPIRVFKAVSDRAEEGALEDWGAATAACSVQLRDHLYAEYALAPQV